jgi:hypothetical protein
MARFSFQPIHSALRAVVPLPLAYRARMAARERRAMRLDVALDSELDAEAAADEVFEAQPAGPGWYASSWELTRGLEVREGLPADAKLHEWLEVCLLA